MIRRLSTLLAAAALAVVPLAASAQITAGTELSGTIDQSLDSKSAVVGQRFTMSNVHSQDNNINGATIYGHVDSRPARRPRPFGADLAGVRQAAHALGRLVRARRPRDGGAGEHEEQRA